MPCRQVKKWSLMKSKRLTVLVYFLVITPLLFSGCNLFKSHTDTLGGRSHNIAKAIYLTLSNPPKIGETAELEFTAYLEYFTWVFYKNNAQDSAKIHMWIEFTWANTKGSYSEAKYAVQVPREDVRVNGDMNWVGNAFQENHNVKLHSTIKLPREGVWEITGYLTGEGKDPSAFYGTKEEPFTEKIRLAVAQNSAAVWGSNEMYFSPLAHLMNFDYGQMSKRILSESQNPVIQELDISRTPRTGEEAVLTCYIYSLAENQDFSTQITFRKRTDGDNTERIPGDILLVAGTLIWKGDLKKDEPAQFSATIKFPKEGDWQIHADGNYPKSSKLGFYDDIRMKITNNRGSFGWGE
jgi:hypothetical protein